MPHFVVDCSQDVLATHNESSINQQIHIIANATGLFDESDIKVRVNPFTTYSVGKSRDGFIHVFSNIMEGRSTEQKANLSRAIVTKLVAMFPHVANVAISVREFERATYCNKSML